MSNIDDFNELRLALGPKRIKTKETEIEQHDLKELLLAQQRLSSPVPISFNSMFMTKVSPNNGCFQESICNPHSSCDCQ